jgi:hypothetical protein
MARERGSKARLFLLELTIMILLLSLAGAVCMRLFAKAHTMSRESTELSMAVLEAQKAAEFVKAGQEDASALNEYLGGELTEGGCRVYYDADWQAAPASRASYRMEVILAWETGGLLTAYIRLYRGETQIYSIATGVYPGEGGVSVP